MPRVTLEPLVAPAQVAHVVAGNRLIFGDATAEEAIGPDRVLPNARTFAIRAAGEIIGVAAVLAPHPREPVPWIGLLALAPAQQGQGLGDEAAALLEELLAREGWPEVRLGVHHDNPRALAFWTRHGYAVIDDRLDQAGHPTWVMRRPSRRGGVALSVGRLAPTPSGQLHLGNALAFGAAFLSARQSGGRLLLRVEDLDRGRARDDVAQAQRDDLRWLGIEWDEEATPQSRRSYALGMLPTYVCGCNRATRLAAACTCRQTPAASGVVRFATPIEPVRFADRARGLQVFTPAPDDDPVLISRDHQAQYPLAVVIDDARDGVTEVVRGADLLEATATQILLHRALDLTPPTYLHTPVLLGPDGKKLSKSHGSTELGALRAAGWTPLRVWQTLLPMLGLPPGRLAEASFDPAKIPPGPFVITTSMAGY